MSAIYKLSIQGIRSFDSNERETIEFGKPLTLIVGTNGSGKTTIIECLKYATTGDLPPNSKGGAFVHDPKITGEKDVRAQVKLAFTGANDVNMIVTRNIQLLVKKTTSTFKTLEGQLVALNKGDRTTLCSRAAELDQQVPLYMGVPKAILDYVIFCHQEDSLWPLSEPSNLKKKFDEIFQAMKFTKALDNLKVIRKEMAVDIKLLKQSVEHLKVDRDRSRSTKINIANLEKRVETYQKQVQEVDRQLDEITDKSDKLFKSNQEFQQVLSKMDGLRNSRSSLQAQIARLEGTTELLDLPREKLEDLVTNFSAALKEKETVVEQLQNQMREKRQGLDEARNSYNELISIKGGLEARQETHFGHKKQLKALVEDLRHKKIVHSDAIASELNEYVDTSMKALEATSLESGKEIEKLKRQIMDLESSRVKQEQQLIYCKKDKDKLLQELDSFKSKFGEMADIENDLAKEKDSLKNYEARLGGKDGDQEINDLTSQIKNENGRILLLENDLEKIQRELLKLNEQADLNAKFSLLKKNLTIKDEELKHCSIKLSEDSRAQTWNIRPTLDLELEFKRFYLKLQKDSTSLTREHNNLAQGVAERQFIYDSSKKKLEELQAKIETLHRKVEDGLPENCTIEDYDELLKEAEESYRVAVENLKMHKTTLEFNLKALEVAKSSNCCYLCQRSFGNDQEQSKLLVELQSRTNTKYEETLMAILKEEEEYLASLRKLERDFSLVKSLSDSKRSVEQEQNRTSSNLTEQKETLSDSAKRLGEVTDDLQYVEKILRPIVDNILRLREDTKALNGDFKEVSDELSVVNGVGGNLKTAEELQVEQKRVSSAIRDSRKQLEEWQEAKEKKSRELSNLIGLIREKNFRIHDFEKKISEKTNLASSIKDNENSLSHIDSLIESGSSSLKTISNRVVDLKADLTHKASHALTREKEERKNLDFLREKRDIFTRLTSDIHEFETVYALRIQSIGEELSRANGLVISLSQKLETGIKDIEAQNRQINDSSNEKKNLKLNIDLADLRTELTQIDFELSNLNIQNAEAQRDEYQQESNHLRSLFEKLSSDNAGRLGEIKQLQNQIHSLFAQLKSDYSDVDNTYQREWVKLQTKTLVTDDIEVYSKALDSAIMKYHSLKMQDINRIIDELWKRTYSGTDVDTIKIKSDEVTNSMRGKTYNYRVVMYKQDAELDMRGRCSAGQKVLASIIIRLALSETFGVNCGVIALDEPTTNLDEENIESLAKSLNNIIEFRRHQKNFQLIVITHDEKFLRYMGAAEFADHFYKVKRDDRQKSQIEWVDINRAIS
ncbi:LADA_0H02916g1_1 [Lachancea dasiensis]|uniref:DNA repair protein RAD50 n=1 Tax=Lachancea dasiensis TaxID=1072105 RepID=A0A1G4K006_9SACH|nr:LADA_0H02916g1_1 [Lachancea dasiensis]